MVKPIPDKYVRKAIFTALNNIVVDGNTIPCFDSRVPTDNTKNHYILMSSQTNDVNKYTKCGSAYESTILLDIITSYYGVGNTGSRLLADNILD